MSLQQPNSIAVLFLSFAHFQNKQKLIAEIFYDPLIILRYISEFISI